MNFGWPDLPDEYYPDDSFAPFEAQPSRNYTQQEIEESELARQQEKEFRENFLESGNAFISRTKYLFDSPSKVFPLMDVTMARGDSAVPLLDITGQQEQRLQFPEYALRGFGFLGLDAAQQLKNLILTPRRGVEISPDYFAGKYGTSNLLVLDARSPLEFERFNIRGSINIWKYWDLESIFQYLWETRSSTPKQMAANVVIVGERSKLRAMGLYRSINIIDRLIALQLGRDYLSYSELYILSGGMQALAAEYEKYAHFINGANDGLVSQFTIDNSPIILEKLAYFASNEEQPYDGRFMFQLVRNPMAISPEFFSLLSYYTSNIEEYKSFATNRKPNPFLDVRSRGEAQRQRIQAQLKF